MSTTYTDGRAALAAIKNYLQTRLSTDLAAPFALWDGVLIASQDEDRPDRTKTKPRALLSVEGEAQSRLFVLPGAWDCSLRVGVRADEHSGGRQKEGPNTAPPSTFIGSDTLLSRALAQALDEKNEEVREAMRALGFYRVQLCAERESNRTEAGASDVRRDPHRIQFTYLRPSE